MSNKIDSSNITRIMVELTHPVFGRGCTMQFTDITPFLERFGGPKRQPSELEKENADLKSEIRILNGRLDVAKSEMENVKDALWTLNRLIGEEGV